MEPGYSADSQLAKTPFFRSSETCPRFGGAAVYWTIRPVFPRGLRLGRLLGALAIHLRFNDLLLSAHPKGNDLIVKQQGNAFFIQLGRIVLPNLDFFVSALSRVQNVADLN